MEKLAFRVSNFFSYVTSALLWHEQFAIAGIQQYLYENGRIDNIFTDIYYEKFTEYLNEVLQKYEVRLNAQGWWDHSSCDSFLLANTD